MIHVPYLSVFSELKKNKIITARNLHNIKSAAEYSESSSIGAMDRGERFQVTLSAFPAQQEKNVGVLKKHFAGCWDGKP